MIRTVWPYLALMLLVAGMFPMLERATGWRLFKVMPPIVMTYLLVTALAVSGAWQVNADIQAAQKTLIAQLVPALLFLLMVNCDLRAIFALGPRVLAVFFCTSISLFLGFVITYLAFRNWLPAGNGWQPLAVENMMLDKLGQPRFEFDGGGRHRGISDILTVSAVIARASSMRQASSVFPRR